MTELMDDDKIKDLFKSFNPPQTSDAGFIARLEDRMETIDLVRRQTAAARRRARVAVVVAAVAGFVSGMILTILFWLVQDWVSGIELNLPALGLPPMSLDLKVLGWCAVALGCVVSAINAYGATLSRLARGSAR